MRNPDVTRASRDRAEFSSGCDNCESPFTRGEWHPVVTENSEDGGLVFHSFCDDDCKNAWGYDD